MRYRDVRMITTTNAFDILNELTEQINGETIKDIIESADINKTYGDIVYIGWDYIDEPTSELIEKGFNNNLLALFTFPLSIKFLIKVDDTLSLSIITSST